ncbi:MULTISPECIES: TonB-dependent receptor domain-containing protein [unclassified Sphingomonas]|uniref:TonB-dependent receptor n=1 Tax=unclassified Sphingomonas TaxID=196159 RepID=UPI00285C8706|nr:MULTISPECIES: TonB-dependent receptor [unclassified Sphingomonas]MDR6116090.1 hemoglobin/transferrin/lactoferrin receptor protein [Sphingomonas sp. SORGH_AS_0789]MDR6150237.1 hemoglobin/transferrin/lactoferrin receptor protein [Sphingomonas sp. SORGH_AS_0742]
MTMGDYVKSGRIGFRWKRLGIGLMLTASTMGVMAAPLAAQGRPDEISLAIPAQPLADALALFAQQAQVQLSVDAGLLAGLRSRGASGRMDRARALDHLLAGTELDWQLSNGVLTLRRRSVRSSGGTQAPVITDALRVEGDDAPRNVAATRAERGHDAVFDADFSSGYKDRAEIERYKGVTTSDLLSGMVNVLSGDARNSGALDPSIRGIQGPGRVPVVIDGTEQALTVWRGYNGASNRAYVDPSLISGLQVLRGPTDRGNIRSSTGGTVVINTLDADDVLRPGRTFGLDVRLEGGNNATDPRLPTLLTGRDYRTVPGFPQNSPSFALRDPSLLIVPRTRDDNHFFSLGDRAVRVAAALRIEGLDLFGAYAYRERGNYFSGTSDPDYYRQTQLPSSNLNRIRRMALGFAPGDEVPNTSSDLESVLLKATWHIADDQYLLVSLRDSVTRYGEIMPSRILIDTGNAQWPLSKVHARAYNAEYKWQPESRWIDLKANLWATDTTSDTYNSGGMPNFATFAQPILVDNARANAINNRYGVNAANTVRLGSTFDLTLSGNWQHEKLASRDVYDAARFQGWRQFPRAGRREEFLVRLDGEWRPASFLKLNAGVSYAGYWAVDDFARSQIAKGNANLQSVAYRGYNSFFNVKGTGADFAKRYWRSLLTDVDPKEVDALIAQLLPEYLANPYEVAFEEQGPTWSPDAQGRYARNGNPCLNGAIGQIAGNDGTCRLQSIVEVVPITAPRRSDHRWAPSLSATVYADEQTRAYARYIETWRFPSMFESTLGFSASFNPLAQLQPEHAKLYEVGLVRDLRSLLHLNREDQRADIKLTFYRNHISNVVERSTNLQFSNIQEQTIAGIEAEARIDTGGFYTQLGAAFMTTNQVCDESAAALADKKNGSVPNCVKYGFPDGFLLTQATPEQSVNWTMGGRFFDKRLELGGRLTYYSRYNNPFFEKIANLPRAQQIDVYSLNVPFSWGAIVTADAYVRYNLNKRFSAELVGTNLNDRYYADPLTRSLMPAPGRTVRLSLTGRF